MRNRFGIALSLALALVLTGTLASAANAGKPRSRPIGKAGPLLRAEPFLVSGDFSGTIGGEIRIDGVGYRLATDATVYEVGKGVVPTGTAFGSRVVCLFGLKSGNSSIVYSVLVRPEVDAASLVTDPSSQVHVGEGPTPQ